MIGAIIGDIVGSPYEFDMGDKTKEFALFSDKSSFTDDTVMTIAIADALLQDDKGNNDIIIKSMRKWGREYPNAGYGTRFYNWLFEENPNPYNSYGNGAAMRVSSVGWLYDNIEETRRVAKITAKVTHNHPEGIKGAEATAAAIFLARNKYTKDEIKTYITKEFGYDLSRTCDEIRPNYHHVESCQETVPEAIIAFLEGNDYEDVIRTAVSLGGDCDTLTCIAGGIAEAFYKIPDYIIKQGYDRLDIEIINVIKMFNKRRII